MKTLTIPQKKMEILKHRRWTGMSIDDIGHFDKTVEGHHYSLVTRHTLYRGGVITSQWPGMSHTQDENDEGETTNCSNLLIIIGMTTKDEEPNTVLTLINLVGTPKHIHSDK